MDIDGGVNAIVIGEINESGAYEIYVRDVIAHDSSDTNIQYYARSHDIVFNRCTSYRAGQDGFGGHNAYGANETYEHVGPPDDPNDTVSNLYIVDSLVYSNASDGIDLQCIRGVTVVKNTKVYNNAGAGIKPWGLEVWLINNLIFENDNSKVGAAGIAIKPMWENSPYYLINNTVVNNGKMELRVVYKNDIYTLKKPFIYMYNNIFQSNGDGTIMLDGPNCPHETCFKEGSNNLYFKPASNIFGVKEYNGSWETDHTFGIDDMSDGTWNSRSGIDANAVSSTSGSDPGFTNLSADDYTLTDKSIAVDSGVNIGITKDIQGTSRLQGNGPDIGAYEYRSISTELPEAPPEAPRSLKIIP